MDINPARSVAQSLHQKPLKAAKPIKIAEIQASTEVLEKLGDEIDLAVTVLRDLLKLAKNECPRPVDGGAKARSAITATGRNVDDIKAINARLYARQAAEQGMTT